MAQTATDEMAASEASGAGVLAVEDPTGTLSYAGMEVAAVLGCFSPENRLTLAGGDATPEKVLTAAKDRRVLHLATHGWAGWEDALAAGVALAEGQSLTLGALLDMRLDQLRLVTLSACETGIAGGDVPDEVVHLGTGLLQAGVEGTVASLWAVNDLSTALLMEHFYEGWQRDGLPPAAALAAAQHWLRMVTAGELTKRYDAERRSRPAASLAWRRFVALPSASRPFEHPIYWAAFTFNGR